MANIYLDNFDDNSLSADWTSVGSNSWAEQNQRLEHDGSIGNWDTGLINTTAITRSSGKTVSFKIYLTGAQSRTKVYLGDSDSSMDYDGTASAGFHFAGAGGSVYWQDGAAQSVIGTFAGSTWYTVTTEFKSQGFKVYFDGGAYSDSLVHEDADGTGQTDSTYYFALDDYTSNAAYIDYFSVDVPDVTPPDTPSATKYAVLDTNNYALNWDEPADADYAYCELRRDLDGTSLYLCTDGTNGPDWDGTDGTSWKFAEDSATYDTKWSNYIDEDVSGSPTYYVRSVDEVANASDWTELTVSSTGGGRRTRGQYHNV